MPDLPDLSDLANLAITEKLECVILVNTSVYFLRRRHVLFDAIFIFRLSFVEMSSSNCLDLIKMLKVRTCIVLICNAFFVTYTDHKELIKRAKQEVINLQEEVGVDVITDGEIERENYIYHFL